MRRLLAVVRACLIGKSAVAYPVQFDLRGTTFELVLTPNCLVACYAIGGRDDVGELKCGQSISVGTQYLTATTNGWVMTRQCHEEVKPKSITFSDKGPVPVHFVCAAHLLVKLEELLATYGYILSEDGTRYGLQVTTQVDLDTIHQFLLKHGFLGSPSFFDFMGDPKLEELRTVMEIGEDGLMMTFAQMPEEDALKVIGGLIVD
jgi:hypothetical protein